MEGGFGVRIGTTLATLQGVFRGNLLDQNYGFCKTAEGHPEL